MIENFWSGFFKRASEKEEEKEQEQGDLPLPRTISVAGPRLDAITEESDRSKFPTFRG